MNKLYTAVFKKEDIGYSVRFTGLPGCFTEGDTFEDAYSNAIEALELMLDGNSEIDINNNNVELDKDEFIVLINRELRHLADIKNCMNKMII